MPHKLISSPQNPLIKLAAGLQTPRDRRKAGLFLVEGIRETHFALQSGYKVETLLYCPDFLPEEKLAALFPETEDAHTEIIALTPALFNTLAYRKDIANVLALCGLQTLDLDKLSLSDTPLLLVLESVEKPGNLGAMLRTADAAGIDAVIVCDAHTDVYNPNVIRSSLGAFFTCQIAVASSAEAIGWMKERNILIFTTYLEGGSTHWDCDFRPASALVMGTEAHGISAPWLEAASARVKIPMRGQIDSMNVSNSAAVLIYEALRQRE